VLDGWTDNDAYTMQFMPLVCLLKVINSDIIYMILHFGWLADSC